MSENENRRLMKTVLGNMMKQLATVAEKSGSSIDNYEKKPRKRATRKELYEKRKELYHILAQHFSNSPVVQFGGGAARNLEIDDKLEFTKGLITDMGGIFEKHILNLKKENEDLRYVVQERKELKNILSQINEKIPNVTDDTQKLNQPVYDEIMGWIDKL